MKFKLSQLNTKHVSQILDDFLEIPINDNVIEFHGDFTYDLVRGCSISPCLKYLPTHIDELIFSGEFAYSVESATESYSFTMVARRYVGHQLYLLLGAIPPSINTVRIKLRCNKNMESEAEIYSEVNVNLEAYLAQIPKTVEVLDLSEIQDYGVDESYNLSQVYQGVPKSIIKLYLQNVDWRKLSSNGLDKLITQASDKTPILVMKEQNIMTCSSEVLLTFFKHLSPTLKSLSLMQCGIGKSSLDHASALISSIPKHITAMSFKRNDFYILERGLYPLFDMLPPSLVYLDLSENYLLTLPNVIFRELISHLPKKLKVLKIYEEVIEPHPIERIADNLSLLPSHISCIGFSGTKWLMGLKMNEFNFILSRLPVHVSCIDYSDCKLTRFTDEDFKLLISQTPFVVKKLILKRNQLVKFTKMQLSYIFSDTPTHVKEIDISENGFERLPMTQLNELADGLPDVLIHLAPDKITKRMDGVLLPYPFRPDNGFFTRLRPLQRQAKLAEHFMVYHELVKRRHISESVLLNILTFVSHLPVDSVLKPFVNKVRSFIHPTQQLGAKRVEQMLIERLNYQAGKFFLDLSYAGLQKISSSKFFSKVLYHLPQTTRQLNLRCNGFGLSPDGFKLLAESIEFLPAHITHLDLSGNRLEYLTPRLLKMLLEQIPESVHYVSITSERPVTAVDHLARINCMPSHFSELVEKESTLLAKLLLLLNDYTQGGSWFMRLIFGYWNRHHLEDISKLMTIIKTQQNLDIVDILHLLQVIPLANEQGTLARTVSFMLNEYHQSLNGPKPPH